MSNVALDQILQAAATAPKVDRSRLQDSATDDGFRAHLDRATEANDSKVKEVGEQSAPRPSEDEESPSIESGQQEQTASEDTAAPEAIENEQQANEEPIDESATSDTEDEVTLSAAIIQVPDENSNVFAVASNGQSADPTAVATTPDQDQPPQSQAQAIADNTLQPPTAAEASFIIATTPDATTTTDTETAAETNVTEVVETPLASAQAADVTSGHYVTTTAASQANPDTKKTQAPSVLPTENSPPVPESEGDVALPATEVDTETANSPNQASESAPTVHPAGLEDPVDVLPTVTQQPAASEANPTPVASAAASEIVAGVENATSGISTSGASDSATVSAESTTNDSPTIDRAKFVQRVGGAIRSAQQRDGQIQLRLSPPELGTLKIQLTVNEGALTANLETETSAARTVLLDNLPALRERLAEQGISIEKFDVDVGREGQQQANQSADEDRNADRKPNRPDTASDSADSEPTVSNNPTSPLLNNSAESALDVEV